MPVSYNYTAAADRLLADAIKLWEHDRRENAAHLAGLSAECMLKSILVGLRHVTPGPDGQIPRGSATQNVRQHIHSPRATTLWTEFQNVLSGRAGAAYASLLPPHTPFHDWEVDHRYADANQVSEEQTSRWTWAAVVLARGIFAHAKQQVPPEVQ